MQGCAVSAGVGSAYPVGVQLLVEQGLRAHRIDDLHMKQSSCCSEVRPVLFIWATTCGR